MFCRSLFVLRQTKFYITISNDNTFNQVLLNIMLLHSQLLWLSNFYVLFQIQLQYIYSPDIICEDLTVNNNPNYSMQLNNTMLDFVSASFLTQLTNTPTRNDNILDLVLSTNPDIIYDLEIRFLEHGPVFIYRFFTLIFGLKYCAKIFHNIFYILDIPFLILIDIPIWFLLTLDRQIYQNK
jgi:hypothetical protein